MVIPCSFAEHLYRADTCQRTAASFFRTAKGTVWPLCTSCGDRHKETLARLIQHKTLDTMLAFGATFDIPLEEPQTLEAFRRQDPSIIASAIGQADSKLLEKLSQLAS